MVRKVSPVENIKYGLPGHAKGLRVAGILDEVTGRFFSRECILTNLDFKQWKEQIEDINPHILLVESIWNGYHETWRDKIQSLVCDEFFQLIDWCKNNSVPTLFWNTEDPLHMNTFLHLASHFDYVFTTDLDCVPLYRRLLGHNRVHFMPLATSPQPFSPLETYGRKNGVCFAGLYHYDNDSWCQDFHEIIALLTKQQEIAIYDRSPDPNDADHCFPREFQQYVKNSLPLHNNDTTYKNYLFGLILTRVKNSSTIHSRQVLELMISNTLTISNQCQGLKNLMGDLIIYYNSEHREELINQLSDLFQVPYLYNKIRLQALRKVLQQHTYEIRMEFLYKTVYQKSPASTSPCVALYAIIDSANELQLVTKSYQRQIYEHKVFYIFTDNTALSHIINQEHNIYVLPKDMLKSLVLSNIDFCGLLSPNNYYGPHYLTDLVLSTKYTTVTGIGKHEAFSKCGSEFILENPEMRYKLTTSLRADRCIISLRHLSTIGFAKKETDFYKDIPCLAVDEFNFCEGNIDEVCQTVDDIQQLDTGISIDELNMASTLLLNNPELYFHIESCLSHEIIIQNLEFDGQMVFLTKLPDGITKIQSQDSSDVKKEITILHEFNYKELLEKKESIVIYYNATIQGDCSAYCRYLDNKKNCISSFRLVNHGCTVLPNKEDVFSFQISFIGTGDFSIIPKEIIISPQPINNIDLHGLIKMERG